MRTSRIHRPHSKLPRTPPRAAPKQRPDTRPQSAHTAQPQADTPSPPAPPSRKPQRTPNEGFVAVGRVLAPFGLKGELRVQPLTDNVSRFAPKSRLWAGDQKVTVSASREAQGAFFLKFKGYPDRTSVEGFRHALLQVPESELPALADGEYYRFQLLGLTVTDRAGAVLGTLDEIIETGANDVYRVRTPDGGDLLLPALDDVIVSIDLDSRTVVADPPPWR